VSEANEYEIQAATRDLQPPRRLPSVLATAFAFSSAVFRSNVSEYWLGRRREADFEAAAMRDGFVFDDAYAVSHSQTRVFKPLRDYLGLEICSRG
jgi:hypothetical protein